MDDDFPPDPTLDWPSRFSPRDVIVLATGELGVVDMVLDYAAEPPARWQLVATIITHHGYVDSLIVQPWQCRHVTDEELIATVRAAGIE